ncbi:hypothetical protein [Planococcus sp. ISL-109]|uniref:hypothetical protein n=1 Tax=Planococcus sp. ISL-109 TaxID=2819166 RepID=UPI001BE74B69|nr:hypothetical protein [Planococcus sp. ISL-109]MBT2581759.1 hypothetical protein [Planococcus sp. ISL-109]
MEKYSTQELCDSVLFITTATFKRHKQKYLEELKVNYFVTEEKIGGKNFFTLEPKNTLVHILDCKVGKKDVDLIARILEVLLDDKVIPISDEIGKALNVPSGTINGYISFFYARNILVEPVSVKEQEIDMETGEIMNEYNRVQGAHVYYDIKSDDTRVLLDKKSQVQVDNLFRSAWKEYHVTTINPLKKRAPKANFQPLYTTFSNIVWKRINETFGFRHCWRVPKPIINPEIKQQLQEYFYQVT